MYITMTHPDGRTYYVCSLKNPLLKRSPHKCHAVRFLTKDEARLYRKEHQHRFMGEPKCE